MIVASTTVAVLLASANLQATEKELSNINALIEFRNSDNLDVRFKHNDKAFIIDKQANVITVVKESSINNG